MGQYASVSKNYAGSSSSGIQYTPHGALSAMTMGNGVVESRGYNSRLQLTRLQAGALLTLWNCFQAGDDAACSSLTTVTMNNGNVQGQKIARGGQSWTQKYSYDGVNRLVWAQEINVWQQTYGYDPFGNRWVSAGSGLPVSALTPAGQSSYAAATNRLAGAYAYDARGNLRSYGSRTLTYDGEDRILAAEGIAPSSRYEYDGEGRRVRAHVCDYATSCSPGNGASSTVYVYDAFGKLAAEYAPNTGQTGTSFFTTDHLGSTRLETNASGQAVGCSDYLPFGEEIPAGYGNRSSCFAPTDNAIKFTGKERDAETGLDFFGARYMSAAQGRFLSPDPLLASARLEDPQTWNRYVYARNNPLRYVDPLGLYASPYYNCDENHTECLNDEQRRILENSSVKVGKETLSGEALWKAMGQARDSKGKLIGEAVQNAFINVTDRLASIDLGSGSALSQVSSLSGFAPDRIYANVNTSLATDLQGSSDFTTVGAWLHNEYNALSFKDWNLLFGNIQFSFNKAGTGADIDIDIGNITNGLLGGIFHAGEVFQNSVFGTKTNQDTVRRLLMHNPKVQTITPSPDPKWNRQQ